MSIEETAEEVARIEIVESYIRDLFAQPSSLSDYEQTLIAGNLRAFYATLDRPKNTNKFRTLLEDAERAVEEYSCRTDVAHIATEMSGLAQRLRDAVQQVCPSCDGSGVETFAVTVYEPGCGYSHDSTDERMCPECGGQGRIDKPTGIAPSKPPVEGDIAF